MKKLLLVSLLIILSMSACTNTSSIGSKDSFNSSISSSSETNSTSSTVTKPTKNIIDVNVEDLELELDLTKDAYFITKYKKYDKYIRLIMVKILLELKQVHLNFQVE